MKNDQDLMDAAIKACAACERLNPIDALDAILMAFVLTVVRRLDDADGNTPVEKLAAVAADRIRLNYPAMARAHRDALTIADGPRH